MLLQYVQEEKVDPDKDEEPGKKSRPQKRCRIKHCISKATFAVRGSKDCELCRTHATGRLDMVSLCGLACAVPGCTKAPLFGQPFPPAKWEFCSAHRKPGMVNLRSKNCFREGCGQKRLYGVAGSNLAEFCTEHAVDGMVHMSRMPSCGRPGCARMGRYGVPGSSSRVEAELCDRHADAGMVDLFKAKGKKSCSHPGCTQDAEYGASTRKRDRALCVEHAPDGMLGPKGWVKEAAKAERSSPETVAASSVDGQCGHPSGCTKKSTHGARGSRKRELCFEHAQNTELVYLLGFWCTAPGCDKWPSYGVAGGARECCVYHAKQGMVNVSSRSRGGVRKTPALQETESGKIKRELSCEEPPCARSTLPQGAGVEGGPEDAPEVDTRQMEPSQLAEPFVAGTAVVEGVVDAEQGNQVAPIGPIDSASQTDVVEPFMGLKKRRRRVDRERPLGLEAGVQIEPGNGESG